MFTAGFNGYIQIKGKADVKPYNLNFPTSLSIRKALSYQTKSGKRGEKSKSRDTKQEEIHVIISNMSLP